ncbi:TonB-dependent receptor [Brytella acorum]|uniref:TonB-dependent receptor n=1 Tax=Brytella acorum TaxID=2959299 RepID=A0AA35XWT7_9PROT|nr:TonB-dependent receptor [Brytella acorum]MDF3624222.1 TonB-dependent receptor [Brytella acorum]CAI9121204.1 TonB-dependent receptor [Brytella acorum]
MQRKRVLRHLSLLTTVAATSLLTLSPSFAAQSNTSTHKKTHGKTSAKSAASSSTTGNAQAPATAPSAVAAPVPASTSSLSVKSAALRKGKTPSNSEQITVVGSRLSQNQISDMFPTQTLGAEQISKRGYTNIGMALMNENPAFSTGDNSPVGSQGSYGAGQFLPNMFNLGSQRTLSLVDGMRFVSDASSSVFGTVAGSPVDASVIPTSMLKNVTTMAIGGAPIYGSDAIAGTVNYQLNDDFQGVRMNGQGDFTQRGDGGSYRTYLLTGTHFDHDRGKIVFDAEYNQQMGLPVSARSKWAGQDQQTYLQNADSNGKYQYILGRDSRNITYSQNGIPALTDGIPNLGGQNNVGIANAAGQTLMFSPNGQSLIPLNTGIPSGDQLDAFGGNGYPNNAYGNIVSPQQRLNLTTTIRYDFTQHLHGMIDAFYQQGHAEGAATSGYYNTALFGSAMVGASDPTIGNANGNLYLNTNNPFLTSAERSTIVNALAANGLPTDHFYLSRNSTDYALENFTTDNRLFRFVSGLNGDFDVGHRNFQWEVKGTYGRSMATTYQPEPVTQNYENALNSVVGANGQITCAPYTNSTLATMSETCAPLNPFGNGQASNAAYRYITTESSQNQQNAQFDIIADIKSKIVTLPAGDVRYVLGYEHRREDFHFNPGAFEQGEAMSDGTYQPYGDLIPVMPTSGAFHTHEAFGELDVPLVSPKMQVMGVYNLAAHAAGRYVYNSVTGGFWTYSAGGAYSPTRDITFKGNYTRALRAPSITELYSPRGSSYDDGADPCSSEFISSGPNPAIRAANCARAGIPSGFQSNINNYTVLGTVSGNSHLQNESADSFEGGFTATPRWVRGFQLTAMYTNIRIRHEIESLSVGDLMASCYDSPSYPNVIISGQNMCQQFTRGSNHQITNFNDGYYNIGQQEMQGLSAMMAYSLPLRRLGLPEDAGEVSTTVSYMHYIKNSRTYLANTYTEFGNTATPQDHFTTNINYDRGPLSFQWQMIYYGGAKYQLNVADDVNENQNFKQYFMFNTTIGYQFATHYHVNFMMNNVFDAKPQYPYVGSLQRYYDAVIGRSFNIAIQADF